MRLAKRVAKRGRMRHKVLPSALAIGGAFLLFAAQPGAPGSTTTVRKGGIFRISFHAASGLDYVDPALASTAPGWAVLDTTCARLLTYPDKPPPAGFRFVPEVAAGLPKISPDRRTYTFTLRSGFRFSDGTPVRASAFARAIHRTLAPGVNSPGAQHTRDIVGAAAVLSGRKATASGVVARGNTLVVRFARPVPDFLHRTTTTFLCAVPPTLPADPEGVGAFPAAGPFYVKDYRPGERVVLRRNRFYRGSRPHHVDGFDIDLRALSPQEVVARVDRGEADWGYTTSGIYFDPSLGLVAKYGINRSRFFVRPGFTLRMLAYNSARPVFRNNPSLRRAVNFALNRRAIINGTSGPLASVPSDQYLPSVIPGFRNAHVYPLERANLVRARQLASGNLRGGTVVLYTSSSPLPMALGQLVKRQLAEIGLKVDVRGFPLHTASGAYFAKLATRGEPWDLALGLWQPSYVDPYAYLNQLLDARYSGGTNFTRFESRAYDQQMRRTASLVQSRARSRAYGTLDVRLARDAAPLAAIDFLKEPTLVSRRVGCIVLRPVLDLTAVCLK
jgi:peptide/nickel transport system substrate-binding protein